MITFILSAVIGYLWFRNRELKKELAKIAKYALEAQQEVVRDEINKRYGLTKDLGW